MSVNNKVFIDTNILIYAYSSDEVQKKLVVQKLFENIDEKIISTQVINEFINVMHKKRKVPSSILLTAIQEIESFCTIALINMGTITHALNISQKHSYSYFDSLIIASAIENGCSILYSEDMHHKHMVSNQLTILNPFA